jgi:hypothetical protein
MMAIVSESADVLIRADPVGRQRWLARLLSPLITVTGVGTIRAESDPCYIGPPLPHTETAVVDFHTSKASAAAALQLFAT